MKQHAGIIIGINQYQFFQPLSFAQHDAEELHRFLVEQSGFSADLCVAMTEISPNWTAGSTYPTKANLVSAIDYICRHQLQPGDVLWFFFSGYGVTWEGEDYLMPIDGNPNDIPQTGIGMRSLLETLKASGAELFVLLDVNRATGFVNGTPMGEQTILLAQEWEIPTVLSSQLDQFSRETASLQLGFFTRTLLDALQTGCKTLDRLEQYLTKYLPQLCAENFRPPQHPLWIVNPPAKSAQAVLPETLPETIPAAIPAAENPAFNSEIAADLAPNPSNQTDQSDQVGQVATASEPSLEPSLEPNLKSTLEPILEPETSGEPTISVTVPDDKKSQSLWDDESKIWLPMVVVGVVIILAAGIGLAKLNQYLEEKEPETTPSGNNITEPANQLLPETAPAGGAIATQSISEPTKSEPFQTAVTKPSETTPVTNEVNLTPVLTEVKQPDNNRMVAISNAQASVFLAAIQQARQVRPSDPNYAQAQKQINDWSQVILEIAKARAVKGNFAAAIAAVKMIPNDAADVYAQGQKLQDYLTEQLVLKNNYQKLLEQADNSVRLGDASSYVQAIAKLRQIKAGQPFYAEARARIEWWSQRIWEIASDRARNGQMNLAIQTASLVPEDSAVYPQVQKALKQWQQ